MYEKNIYDGKVIIYCKWLSHVDLAAAGERWRAESAPPSHERERRRAWVGPSHPRTGVAASPPSQHLPPTDGSGGGSCGPATTPRLGPLRTGAVAAPRLKPPADGCGGGAGAGEIGRGERSSLSLSHFHVGPTEAFTAN
ncbi:hypothetical protein SEVIR_7G299355v4 [Setaria viridis]